MFNTFSRGSNKEEKMTVLIKSLVEFSRANYATPAHSSVGQEHFQLQLDSSLNGERGSITCSIQVKKPISRTTNFFDCLVNHLPVSITTQTNIFFSFYRMNVSLMSKFRSKPRCETLYFAQVP